MRDTSLLDEFTALLTRHTQSSRLLRLSTPLGADKLLAECVRGEEAIGGYRFTISALSLDAGIALASLLGQPALLELLTAAPSSLRPFHGYLTDVTHAGSDGGMARYTLVLEPWTAMLGHGRDSRVFQDMTVWDILDAVFGAWQGRGLLAPAWRFDIAQPEVYPIRSLTTQYQESDLAFAERLMNDAGLFYFFEHRGDASSLTMGSHEMVIADHNGAFKPNRQALVRFTQPGAVMKEDSMDRWRSTMRMQTGAVELKSWDYRQLSVRSVSAGDADDRSLVSCDVPGAYAYADRTQGQRIADRQLQAIEAQREVFTGAGTVRSMAPGTTFALLDHASSKPGSGQRFLVTRVAHLMHNNLPAEFKAQLVQALGQAALSAGIEHDQTSSLHTLGSRVSERPLYRNRIDAIASSVAYRTSSFDGHGRRLHPRPTVRGQQSAIVVGPPEAAIHTDRDHRIKVQFHWQRGAQSHSRLATPYPDGQTGAPGDDSAGTWVRVATPLAPIAGANWGAHALPRVGQEVLVDFIDGDIDRPVVIAALYSGRGQPDAQHNQVAGGAGPATGNAPAWFPGDADAHAHPAVLSGIKSQAMQGSQRGSAGYSQLVLDDSAGEARIALQQHATEHAGTAELNLGHLRHQSDNQRRTTAGLGAELKSEHAVALRAGQGLSTNARKNGHGGQLDSSEAQAQVSASAQLQASMADSARKHNAKLKAEAAPAQIPAIKAMAHAAEVLGDTAHGGDASAQAYSDPQLQLSSAAGIVAVTAADAHLVAGATSSISAHQDINAIAQGSTFHAVRAGVSLFTYGKANAPDKPNQELGLRLHAATGRFSMQSQSDVTRLTADKQVTVASMTKSVTVAAKQHVMLTAQGAFIKLEGGNIMLHGPGKIEFKASMKELAGPQSATLNLPLLPQAEGEPADQHFILKTHDGEPVPNRRYRAYTGNKVIEGFTDAAGKSALLDGYLDQLARFELVDTTHDEHFILRDPLGTPMANMRYRMRAADGHIVEGMTDEQGQTSLFTSDKVEEIELLLVDEDYPPAEGTD